MKSWTYLDSNPDRQDAVSSLRTTVTPAPRVLQVDLVEYSTLEAVIPIMNEFAEIETCVEVWSYYDVVRLTPLS